jgi:two-component system, chemotaxis family, chemotaxis protein CheY
MRNPSPIHLDVVTIHDSAAMKAIISAILRGAGVRGVRGAETADGLMEAMIAKPPDLIICDYNHTHDSNIDLMRRIRACEPEGIRLLPVIYIARFTEMQAIMAARDAGATEILARPISAKGLLVRIDNIIRQPRPFIKTKTYFGPCRRRRLLPFPGEEKRVADPVDTGETPGDGIETALEPPAHLDADPSAFPTG